MEKALVPWAGFEPARYPYQRILSPPSLPIPSPRHKMVRHLGLEPRTSCIIYHCSLC